MPSLLYNWNLYWLNYWNTHPITFGIVIGLSILAVNLQIVFRKRKRK